jgi:hypothetical protein
MTRIAIKNLKRQVEALESSLKRAKPSKRSLLLDLSIAAITCAWTSKEIEEMLAAPIPLEDQQLSSDRRRRWVKHLDEISIKRFGMSFGALLRVAEQEIEAREPSGIPKCLGDLETPSNRATEHLSTSASASTNKLTRGNS